MRKGLGCLTRIVLVIVLLVLAVTVHKLINDLTGPPVARFSDIKDSDKVEGVLRMVGARGRSTDWAFRGPSLWAAPDGLTFMLRNAQTGQEFKIHAAPPSKPSWSRIRSSSTKIFGHEPTTSGSFTLPELPAPELQSLEGRLHGVIIVPETQWVPSEARTGYKNVPRILDIPVRLDVIAPHSFDQLLSERRWRHWKRILLPLFVSLAVVVVFGVILFRFDSTSKA